MRELKYIVISILFVSVFSLKSQGQTAGNLLGSVTIASPTAASLGKFGDIPVSYHTGVPQIGIPIYTVKAGPLSLPISLDYHASGIKVMEPAGWVGAGWALNAGGVITRSVNGMPDEAGSNSGGQLYGHFSNYGYNSYFYTSTFGGMQQDWQDFTDGQRDGEPDLFFFNFGGYTGKFYFRDDRTPVIVPEQDLQVIPSYSGGRSINYFTIITPDGAKYIFGNSPNVASGAAPIEITNSYTAASGASVAPPTSSWYLNQVVSADNQFTINLTYQAESYGYYTLAMFPVDAATQTGPDGSSGYSLVKNLMQGVRLSQISFPNGTVNFTPGAVRTDLCDNLPNLVENANTSATSLGGIQINDGNGFCNSYQFYYSYFTGSATALPTSLTLGNSFSTDVTRLRLDSVKESSCDSTVRVPPYKFTYYTGTVPRRLSFGVDHWGYYNGADGNVGLIPTIIYNETQTLGAARDASWPQMMACMLTRIDYPTGGYNTFTFESNSGVVDSTVNGTNILVNQILNGGIYHQGYEYPTSVSIPCTSNGSTPVQLTINTNCNFGGSLSVVDASNNTVYSTSIASTTGPPGSQDTITTNTYNLPSLPPTMPAGNYTVHIDLQGNPLIGGAEIIMSQPETYEVANTVTLGGIRIKTTTAVDGVTSNNIVTNYSYTNQAGTSTAVLYSVPTYAMAIRNDIIANTGYWTVDSGFVQNPLIVGGCPTSGDYLKSPGSIRPMQTVQGSIIGYQMVTVSQPGNGSSVYSYYPTENGYPSFTNILENNAVTSTCNSGIPNYPPAPLPFDARMGELKSEQHYDNSGNLLKDIYYYPTFNESPILSTPAFIVKQRSIDGNLSYLGTMYSLNTVKETSMLTIEHDYNTAATGGYVTKTRTTYYGSNFHNQPTRVVTSTSTGDSLETNTLYADDFRLASCDGISDCSTEYNNACASCQSTFNTASAACGGSSSCITTAYLNFMQCNTNARISYVSCRNTNYMDTNSLFNQCHVNFENAADTLQKPILVLQDNFMNPAIETNQWRDAYLLHSGFTGYTLNSIPANFPYPARTQLVNLQAPSNSFAPASISGNTIAQDSRYLNESLYTFASGNPVQVTPHDGVTLSYVWDYLNQHPIAKVSGTTVDQVAYTSFEADGSGSWIIPPGGRVPTTAITGSSSYNLPNGVITRSGLTSSTTYIVSYWSSTGSSYDVTGTTAIVQGKTITINGTHWTYFEHKVTGVSGLTINGSGYIDELRLYPSTAQMTTYTYRPLIGMTTQCDVANRNSYYFYDALGRLSYIKDQDGNIIKTYQYHYNGQ